MKKLSFSDLRFLELPNQLTLARVAIIPILLLVYPFDFLVVKVLCAILFAAGAATDFFDGYLARKYKLESRFGAMLDPIADKMLIGAALVLVTNAQALWAWMAGVLICREIAISGLRLIAAQNHFSLDVSSFGKLKTVAQDVGIFCLMINEPIFGLPMRPVGMTSMWLALGLSLYSAYLYGQIFWESFKKVENPLV